MLSIFKGKNLCVYVNKFENMLYIIVFFLPVYRTISSCFEFQSDIQIFSWNMYVFFRWNLGDMSINKFNHLSNMIKFWFYFRGLLKIFIVSQKKKKKHILRSFEKHLCVYNLILVLFSNGLSFEKKNAVQTLIIK